MNETHQGRPFACSRCDMTCPCPCHKEEERMTDHPCCPHTQAAHNQNGCQLMVCPCRVPNGDGDE